METYVIDLLGQTQHRGAALDRDSILGESHVDFGHIVRERNLVVFLRRGSVCQDGLQFSNACRVFLSGVSNVPRHVGQVQLHSLADTLEGGSNVSSFFSVNGAEENVLTSALVLDFSNRDGGDDNTSFEEEEEL